MPIRKRESTLPVRAVVVGAAVVVVTLAIAAAGWSFIASSDYFKVRQVLVSGADPGSARQLQGRNILFLDLERESARLLSSCSECSKVSIVKLPPSRLCVQFVRRNPVALVKAPDGYFGLDRDGTMYARVRAAGDAGLPVILGLEKRPAAGPARNVKELALALLVLRETSRSKALQTYEVKTLSVGDPMNMSLLMRSVAASGTDAASARDIEIKLGPAGIRDKFVILDNLVAQTKVDIGSIHYLDMRFKDPVMKLRKDK